MKLSRFKFILICLLVASGIVACGPSAQSERLTGQLTLEYLAAKADSILVGEVNNVTYYQEGEGNIYTQVTLSAEQTIKGETEGEVVIMVPGGKVDGLVLMVTDTASFQLGERGVVFLDQEAEGIFTVVGGFQGKFIIDNNMVGDKPLTEFIDQIEDVLSRQ
jgi:hypothetical protein